MELNEFQYKAIFTKLKNEGAIRLYPCYSKTHVESFFFVSFFEYRGMIFNCYHSNNTSKDSSLEIASITDRALKNIQDLKEQIDKIIDGSTSVNNLARFINEQVTSFKLTRCRYNWLPKHGLINRIDFNVIVDKVQFHIDRDYSYLDTYEYIIDFFGYEPENFIKYSSVKYE